MANIYQLQQDLLAIFDVLEENGGELTPELEEQLAITQDCFKDKVESYTKVIRHYQGDLVAIKAETDRLKKLKERKEKTIERISKVVIEAIENFGDEKPKTKVKYIDFGTGEVSVRNTQAVELYDSNINHIIDCVRDILELENENNQLDVISKIDSNMLIDRIATKGFDGAKIGISVTPDDLNAVDMKITINVPLRNIVDNSTDFPVIREIVKRVEYYEIKSDVKKSDIKNDLKADGAFAPHVAKLVNNKSLTIK